MQARDAVVEKQPAGPYESPQARDVAVELAAADMLVHADARDLVEGLVAELPVVGQAHLDAVGEPRAADALARVRGLRGRQGHSDGVHAVARGSVQHERAPAAADVE